MSDQPTAPPPTDAAPLPTSIEEPSEGPNRVLLIVLGVVVLLAALFAVYTFVLAPADDPEPVATLPAADDGGDADPATPDASGEQVPVEGETEAASTGGRGTPVPETFEIFSSRDPFQQLVIEVPAGSLAQDEDAAAVDGDDADDADDADEADDADDTSSSADAASPTVSSPDDGGDLSATEEPTDEPTDEPTEGADVEGVSGQGTSPQSASPGRPEYWERPGAGTIEVAFVATTITTAGSDAVVMSIDDEEHEVVEGEVFADRFWLLDIHEDCGTFLFGDSRFTLCVGETIMK